MNFALWIKALREGKWLLLGTAALLFVFFWIRVWITSQFNMREIRKLLYYAPDFVSNFFVVPVEVLASPAGRIAVSYDDPLVVVAISIWAIARGSDAVSGEIGRGTMELLLAQPVRRIEVLFVHAAVTLFGAAVLAVVAFLGTFVGLKTIELESVVRAKIFLAPALNLFSLGVFLSGLTTMLSSCDRYRSRTIGIAVSFYVVETIIKLVSMAVPDYANLRWLTFLTAFEPQKLAHAFWPRTLAAEADQSWTMLWQYNGLLITLGLAGYLAAAVIFSRRDLPAPL